jgi:hypothetical protein
VITGASPHVHREGIPLPTESLSFIALIISFFSQHFPCGYYESPISTGQGLLVQISVRNSSVYLARTEKES